MSNNTRVTKENVTYMQAPKTMELDGAALKAEAEKSHEFLTLVYYGANRHRNREVTDVEQMRKQIVDKHKEELDPGKWLAAFKTLEDMGLGALIMGRTTPTRFRWNYSLKAIGSAALAGSTVTIHRIVPTVRAGKVVNSYDNTRLTDISVNVKQVDELDEVVATKKVVVPRGAVSAPLKQTPPPVAARPAPTTGVKHMIYLSLRPDYTFEADVPTLTEQEADAICKAIRRCVN